MRQQLHSGARFWLSATLAAVLLLAGALTHHHPVSARQGGNLLNNPGFEEPYTATNNDASLRVANSWTAWYLPQGSSTAINARPEYKPAPANRVRSGSAAQEYNTFYATHTAGVYQRVPVAAGTNLRFAVHIRVWSSATFANPDVSEDPNNVIINVGIDPTGGTDPTSSAIVWSTNAEFYDEYREMSVTASAQRTAVTVFVRTAPQGFVGVNNIYLDDASLVNLGQVQPTATATLGAGTPTLDGPTATASPSPTGPTRTPTAQPTNTRVPPSATPTLPPEFTSTLLHTVRSGDSVWALARQYDSTMAAIIQVNGLNQNGLIHVGQILVIPVRQQFPQPPTFTPPPTSMAPTLVPPTPVVPTPVPPALGTYVVQPGDTLSALAVRFNTTVATLAQINNIVNPNRIYPGQVLRVPGTVPLPPVPTPVVPTVAPVPTIVAPITHVVQPGDNLYRIALRYGVTWDAIARANGLANPSLIFPGQVLIIPR